MQIAQSIPQGAIIVVRNGFLTAIDEGLTGFFKAFLIIEGGDCRPVTFAPPKPFSLYPLIPHTLDHQNGRETDDRQTN